MNTHLQNSTHYSQPTKLEWTVFGLSAVAALVIVALLFSGCASAALPGETKAEAQLDTVEARQLSAALASQPEVRPEVVARGNALAADPSYPGPEIIAKVAGMILNSPDPSEDQS